MAKDIVFRKSAVAAWVFITTCWVLLVIIGIFFNLILKDIVDLLNIQPSGFRAILNLFIILLFLVATLTYLLKWNKTKYKISGEGLIIDSKNKVKSIRLASVSSVKIRQSRLGKNLGYGDVDVYLYNNEPKLTIKNIEDPFEVVEQIKK